MWNYQKQLQYPVNIKNPNPAAAKVIITQLGGPDGELGAATRYLSQRYVQPYKKAKAILTDIGTEAGAGRRNGNGSGGPKRHRISSETTEVSESGKRTDKPYGVRKNTAERKYSSEQKKVPENDCFCIKIKYSHPENV